MLFDKLLATVQVPAESLSRNLDNPEVQLVHLWVVLALNLPLDIVVPQLVTAPLPPTLRHGSRVLTADEGSIILLYSLAVVQVVDPQVGR